MQNMKKYINGFIILLSGGTMSLENKVEQSYEDNGNYGKESKFKKFAKYSLVGAAALTTIALNSCAPKAPGQSNEGPSNTYNTKPQVVSVELDNWNTLPGDISFELSGVVSEGDKVYFDMDVNGQDYLEGSVDVVGNSFTLSEIIDSNLYYSNIEPLNVEVKLSLNSDLSTPTDYSTAITLPMAIVGIKAPDLVKKVEDLVDLYDSGSYDGFPFKELKIEGQGIIDKADGDLYTVFEFRKGPVFADFWYICRAYIYSYEDEQKGSLIAALHLPPHIYSDPIEGSSVIYDVDEYNPYKGLSLDQFINTYLSTVATPIDNDSVEMLLSSEAFNKLVEQDEHFIPLFYRKAYIFNDEMDVDKPVLSGFYILENFVSLEEGTASREPLQTLKGVIIFPRNRSPPFNFLVSTKTGNLTEIGPFRLDGAGRYTQVGGGPFLNSPYLREVLNLPGRPSGYNYDVDMLTTSFDHMDTVLGETRILTPEEFKEVYSYYYNVGQRNLNYAIEVINGLTLP